MAGDAGRGHPEAGNTLMLMPAALLIVLGLAAVAIDGATSYLAQRRLADVAAAVANDAVAALNLDTYYTAGDLVLDQPRGQARAVLLRDVAGSDRTLSNARCDVHVQGNRATAQCRAQSAPIIAPAWAWGNRVFDLAATESARAVEH